MSASFLDASHRNLAKFKGLEDPNWHSASEKIRGILCVIDLNVGLQQAVNTAPALCDIIFERKDKLHQIDEFFAGSINLNARVAIISGRMLGVGCTELASSFCHNERGKRYQHILWFESGTGTRFNESCVKNAVALQLISTGESTQDGIARAALQNWLHKGEKIDNLKRKTRNCLLVFDGVVDLRLAQQLFPNSDLRGHIILTTIKIFHLERFPTTAAIEFHIKPLLPAESLYFFRKILIAKGYSREISEDSILSISASCNNLPLLLAIVARHIAATGLEDCSLNRKQIMDIISLSLPEDSLRQNVEDLDSCAQHLLRLLSFLDSQGVPNSLFPPDTTSTPTFVDCDGNSWLYVEKQAEKDLRQHLDTAIDILRTKGFLNPDRICLHPMVQIIALQSMSAEERVNIWSWAITLIFKITPKQQGGTPLSQYWKGVSQWLPHVQHLLQQWQNDHKLTREDRKLSDNPLLIEIGRIWAWMLYEQGRLLEASDIIEISLDLLKCSRDARRFPNISVSATSITYLYSDLLSIKATLAHERNQHQAALSGMRTSKSLRESVSASERDLVDSDTNIAVALIMMEDLSEEATDLFKSGLAYIDRNRDDKVMQLLEPKYHANLALCYLLRNYLPEALEEIHISLKGEKDDLEKARVYFTLGKIQLAANNPHHPEDLRLAEIALQKCRDLRQLHSGTHYLIGYTMHKLGEISMMRDRLGEALANFELAAQSLRQAQGQISDGPLIRTLWAWSSALHSQGKWEQAGHIRQEAWDYIRRSDLVLKGKDGKTEICVANLTLDQCQARVDKGEFEQWVPFPHR